jgi:hypothetical protein
MQTQRLTTLINPSHVEQLLDSYVSESGVLPSDARKRVGWDNLPVELRHFAAQAVVDGYVCSVWTDGDSNWFFAGSLALERAREVGRPVLEVLRCDDIRHARASCFVARLPDGSWSQCGNY